MATSPFTRCAERIAHWSFNEGEGRRARESVSGQWDDIAFALAEGRFQPPQSPRWKPGIDGSALVFDGYSTFIRRPVETTRQPRNGLTVSVWVAPGFYDLGAENRPSTIVNQHNREKAEGYLLGIGRHGAWTLQLGAGGQWIELWTEDESLGVPLQSWSHLAATFDGKAGRMTLYLNGVRTASRDVPAGSVITPCGEDLLIGRNNHGAVLANAFMMNHFDGRMDELSVWDRPLDEANIREMFESDLARHAGGVPVLTPQDFILPRDMFRSDRHRPQFHVTTPGHWMNEPHAPFYYKGLYHLFYQFNPKGPFFHYLHWGHCVSEDLVHWRDLPPALYPEPGTDPDGVWSGSATYDRSGEPVLFYTAGNDDWQPNQRIALARSKNGGEGDLDLIDWVKHSEAVAILDRKDEILGEFRDPFVWREDGRWVMLVGSGVEGKGGTALVYESNDLVSWTFHGPFYQSDYDKYPILGTAWELPVLLPLRRNGEPTDRHVFIVSPWGPGSRADIRYWVGRYDADSLRFEPDREEPLLIDYGDFHFTGPSGMVDPATGRSLLFTIAQGERTPEIDYDCGWSHGAGLPVSLMLLEDGTLGVAPIEEAALLREEQLLEVREASPDEANRKLSVIRGDMLEIELVLRGTGETRTAVSLRRSMEGEEETVLYYDRSLAELGVDRTRATRDVRERTSGIQAGALDLRAEPLRLRIFIDRSLIEAYANNRKSLTTRAYPSRPDSNGLRLSVEGEAVVERLSVWRMGSAYK